MAKISMHIDMAPLLKKLDAVLPLMGKTRDAVLRDEGKILVNKVIKITPPISKGVTGPAARKQGEAKTAADIRRAYTTPADCYKIISERLDKRAAGAFWGLIRNRQYDAAQRILTRAAPQLRLAPFDGGADHRAARGASGTVGKNYQPHSGQVVREKKDLDSYIKTRQKNVGLYASSLLNASTDLGGDTRIPAWVKRHRGKLGGGAKLTGTGDSAVITITATPPFAARDTQRRMDYALASTIKNLPKRVRAITRSAMKKAGLTTAVLASA